MSFIKLYKGTTLETTTLRENYASGVVVLQGVVHIIMGH